MCIGLFRHVPHTCAMTHMSQQHMGLFCRSLFDIFRSLLMFSVLFWHVPHTFSTTHWPQSHVSLFCRSLWMYSRLFGLIQRSQVIESAQGCFATGKETCKRALRTLNNICRLRWMSPRRMRECAALFCRSGFFSCSKKALRTLDHVFLDSFSGAQICNRECAGLFYYMKRDL